MSPDLNHLEQMLQGFDTHKAKFLHPRALSFEHDDVTVKYLTVILRLAEEQGKSSEALVDGFCTRFGSDKGEMTALLSDKHAFVDYHLYTAFSLYGQLKLGLSDEEFFQEACHRTFTDYQDSQIAIARFIPLNLILSGMGKQFKNWTKVTDTHVEKMKKGGKSFKITRRTLDQYKQRLIDTIGQEITSAVLRRDCDFTVAAFHTTFSELFKQPDIQIIREHCEADGFTESKYIVKPTSAYKTQWRELGRRLGALVWPWGENKLLTDQVFELEQTVRARGRDLEVAYADLERKHELVVGLQQKLAKLKHSGGSHAIRNIADRTFGSEKEDAIDFVAKSIYETYSFLCGLEGENDYQLKLTRLCAPFGISTEMLSDLSELRRSLHKIKFDEPSDVAVKNDLNDGLNDSLNEELEDDLLASLGLTAEELGGIRVDFGDKEVYFISAYETFQKEKERMIDDCPVILRTFDPFSRFQPLRKMREFMGQVNERLAQLGDLEFVDSVLLSTAIAAAAEQAKKDKNSSIELKLDLHYDPQLRTNRDTLIYTVRDFVYNAVDAGAKNISFLTRRPAKEERLPHLDHFSFTEFPSLYLRISDDGSGIPPDKARQLNEYLLNPKGDAAQLSTKTEKGTQGGLGTKNLADFLGLHKGVCHYEPNPSRGTFAHIYLERLEL